MSWSKRSVALVLAAAAVLGAAIFIPTAPAQKVVGRRGGVWKDKGVAKAPAPPKGFDLGSLTLPKDDDMSERVRAAEQNITKRDFNNRPAPDYKKASEIIQKLLEEKDDKWVAVTRKDPEGREVAAYASVKKEAARLLANLPKAGRDTYESLYGAKATALVRAARAANDHKKMAEAYRLYLYTEAGAEAANWLATYMLDRGNFSGAASFFQTIIDRDGIKALSDKTLVKAAYAFHLGGGEDQEKSKDAVFKELDRRNAQLKLGGEELSLAQLREAINGLPRTVGHRHAGDVLLVGGSAGRSSLENGGVPLLEPGWRAKTIFATDTEKAVNTAESLMNAPGRAQPIVPASVPITATITKKGKEQTLLVYRSYWGIEAADAKTGRALWWNRSAWGLDGVFGGNKPSTRNEDRAKAVSSWLTTYNQTESRPAIVFENSVLGSFSSDGKRVYVIDDLAVPPPDYGIQGNRFGGPMPTTTTYHQDINRAIHNNRLQALDLARDGKLEWELGGHKDEENTTALPDTFFLGPPLPLGDRLFVLTEANQELRVVCIEAATGNVLLQQTLANTKDLKMPQDPYRRTEAAHLAYGEGILVIPTNAGAVFGYDLLSNSLVWAYPYREKGNNAPPPPANPWGGVPAPQPGWKWVNGRWVEIGGHNKEWKVTPPVVQDGKVVFTAPDAKSIHCVNLRDGSPLWSQPRHDDDVYFAGVFNGKAVIVGKGRARGVSLARGETLWELETGIPSGVGAACPLKKGEESDTIYYLPLKASVHTNQPEICAINIDKGIVHAHVRSRKKEVPGNLVFTEGGLLSQGPRDVIHYPQLEVRLAELTAKLTKGPADADILTERGDYRVDKGDLAGAIADFRQALRQKDVKLATRAKARGLLYDALTDYFQRDFDKAERYIAEYEELCKVDLAGSEGEERARRIAEELRRKRNFLCLVGKGREAQNRLVDAFEKYLELGTTARKDELIQVVDEPSVRAAPDVWSQGRIAAMVANAKDADQRKALEDLITARWKKVQESKPVNVADLRNFVQMFGSLFAVGKEARLALAERLMEDTDLNSLLEAELQLSLLRGPGEKPEVAARAVEALARLNTRKGLLEDAAYYYRQLGKKYPKVVITEGKTGAELLEDLETDKRFLPFLDTPARLQIRGRTRVETQEGPGHANPAGHPYELGHVGEPIPFFAHARLSLRHDSGPTQVRLADATGEERWSLSLSSSTLFNQLAAGPQSHRLKFHYQTLGHLVVVQAGHLVAAFDPLNKGRPLWEKSLFGPGTFAPVAFGTTPPVTVDERDGSVELQYPDGWKQRIGTTGPLFGSVVCLLARDGLTAVDPVTGRTLWTRSDVNSRCHVFADGDNLYAVSIGDDKSATGARAFRAYDGVSVRVKDFSREYSNRLRILGRNLLVSETDAKGVVTLRLYDVLEGKDLWRQTFAAGSAVMHSEDPGLIGVTDTSGKVVVIDLETAKPVMEAKVLPKYLQQARGVYLLADADSLFVAVDGPPDPNVVVGPMWPGMPGGASAAGVQSLMQSGMGFRSVPVNGAVYAFNRKTGKQRWHDEVNNSMLVISHFADMPVLLYAAHYAVRTGAGAPGFAPQGFTQKHATNAIDKKSGKLVYENTDGDFYHTLNVDPLRGRMELINARAKGGKIAFQVVEAK